MSPRPRPDVLWSRLFVSTDAQDDLQRLGGAVAWAVASLLAGLLDGTSDPHSLDIREHPTDPRWRLVDIHGHVVVCRWLEADEMRALGQRADEGLQVAAVVPRSELQRRLEQRTPDE